MCVSTPRCWAATATATASTTTTATAHITTSYQHHVLFTHVCHNLFTHHHIRHIDNQFAHLVSCTVVTLVARACVCLARSCCVRRLTIACLVCVHPMALRCDFNPNMRQLATGADDSTYSTIVLITARPCSTKHHTVVALLVHSITRFFVLHARRPPSYCTHQCGWEHCSSPNHPHLHASFHRRVLTLWMCGGNCHPTPNCPTL